MENIKLSNKWEVLTPNGWKSFKGIIKDTKKGYLKLNVDGHIYKCTKDHKFYINNKPISASDLKVNDKVDSEGNGLILDIEIIDDDIDVYDLLEVFGHKYLIGNGLHTKNCDEFAFVPENIASAYWASAFPTISQGGRVIVVSTPNGTSGLFYDLYTGALNGKNPFKHMRINWELHPDRDEEWKKLTYGAIGKVRFAREYECSFAGSTNTLVDGNFLTKMKWEDPSEIPEEGFNIWKRPVPGHIYGAGVDVSKGSNSDFAVINVFDLTVWTTKNKLEQVAEFRRNDILLPDFIEKVYKIGKYYNNAALIIEENGLGSVVINALHNDKEYENLYFDYEKLQKGVNANVRTKPLAISYLKEDIEKDNIVMRSENLIKELSYFEELKPGVFGAKRASNCHDDCVSSTYWVCYMLRSRYMDDILYYAGRSSVQKDNSSELYGNEQKDNEILDSFNRILRPNQYARKQLRNDLSR